jgi:hypothetical protein
MLRGRPQDWKAIPFSYKKMCYAVEIWFGLLSLGLLAWQFLVSGREAWQLLAIWAAVNFVFQRLLEGLVWKSLPADLKANIPYDAVEAARGKGVIHSYRDLFRWLRMRKASEEW